MGEATKAANKLSVADGEPYAGFNAQFGEHNHAKVLIGKMLAVHQRHKKKSVFFFAEFKLKGFAKRRFADPHSLLFGAVCVRMAAKHI